MIIHLHIQVLVQITQITLLQTAVLIGLRLVYVLVLNGEISWRTIAKNHVDFVKVRLLLSDFFSIFQIPLTCIMAWWISKVNISQYFHIQIWKLFFLTKTEWEKCPISDILDKPTKIFQIRRFCASLRNNKPWPFLVSKAA